jgi:hypothetical protein
VISSDVGLEAEVIARGELNLAASRWAPKQVKRPVLRARAHTVRKTIHDRLSDCHVPYSRRALLLRRDRDFDPFETYLDLQRFTSNAAPSSDSHEERGLRKAVRTRHARNLSLSHAQR